MAEDVGENCAPPLCAVVASELESWDHIVVAKALSAALKTPLPDQIARARRAWGILAENLESQTADCLARDLSAAGLPAFCLPQNLIEDPKPALIVKSLFLEAEGLRAVLPGAEPMFFEWGKVLVLCAAALPQITERTITTAPTLDLGKEALKLGLSLATGIPMMGGGKKAETKTSRSSDFALTLDVVVSDFHLRVDAERFDFSGLGQLKTYGIAANFKILLSEAAMRSSRALLGRGTRMMQGLKPVRDIGHESAADLDRECRWLLTLAALRRGKT